MKYLFCYLFVILFNSCCYSAVCGAIHIEKKIENLPPTATITGPSNVCQNASGIFVTFTGAGGTAPYTFTYNINGGSPNLTVVTTSGNSITVNVPTNVNGSFVYNLVNVKDSTSAVITQNGSVTVVVNAQTTIDFTFTNDNTCSGTNIQFTTIVNPAGTYSYLWDFGDGTPTSTAQNPSHSYSSLGCGTATFTAKVTVTGNGCTAIKTKTVTVKHKPDINFEDVNATSSTNQFSNCQNASATNPIFNITVGNISATSCAASYSIDWDDSTGISNNVVFPISHTYNVLKVYNMIITALGTNGCANTKTFQVKNISNPAAGVLNPGGTIDMCLPTPLIQYTIGNWGQNSPGTTYSIDYGDGTTPLTLNQDNMILTSYFTASNPALSTNYPIPYSYTTNSCPNPKFKIKLTVTNACKTTEAEVDGGNTISKTIANFNAPPVSCITTNVFFTNTSALGFVSGCITETKFKWDFGDPISGALNIINSGFVNNAPNANHTFTASGTYTVTLTATNTCGTTTKTQQICIEAPIIPLFTLNNIQGCTPLAVTTTNTTVSANSCVPITYKWIVTHQPLYCGTLANIPNQTTTNATYNFTNPGIYKIKLEATNGCGTVTSLEQTITVKKPPTASITPISDSCGPVTLTPVANVDGCAPNTSILTYAWTFGGGNPGTSSSQNPGPIAFSGNGAHPITLVVTNECGVSATANQSFNINELPVITNTSLSQTICSNNQTSSVTLTTTPSGATYAVTVAATSGITGFPAASTVIINGIIPISTITSSLTTAGTVTYTITPKIGTCSGTAVNYVINVNPAPNFIAQPQPNSVCQNGILTPLSVATSSGSPQYQWYSNTSSSTSGATIINGATGANYSPSSANVGVLYYYCVLSFSSGGCNSINSNIAKIEIFDNGSITTQPITTQNLCVGVTISSPLTTVSTGGDGTKTYQWYSNSTNTNTGGTAINGANNINFTPTVFNTAGTYYYYVTISFSNTSCVPTTSNVATIIVLPDPIITTQPQPKSICQGATPNTLTIAASGGSGAFSYQWYSNVNNSNSGGNLIPSATNLSFIPPTTSVGTFYYYCIATQTATSGCETTSQTAAITVNLAPTISTQPTSSSLCLNGTPTLLSVAYANGVGTPTYQWFSNTANNTTSDTAISGANNTTYAPPNNVVGTIYYYCIITFAGGGGCSSITSNVAEVILNPLPTISAQPTASQTICAGGTIPALTISYSNGIGNPTYQWFSNTTNSNSGGTAISGANLNSYTPLPFATAGNFYFYATVTLSGSGCGNISSNVAKVEVLPDPIITTQPQPQSICQGAIPNTLTIAASGGSGAFSYQWYSNVNNSNSGGNLIPSATN
ncbi:MAG: PKD domain-containing protein, partial [Flavobacterium sp.]|nr:PKD domain-containing protein [Flavobacterium sp.]